MTRTAGEVSAALLASTSVDDLNDRLEQAIVEPTLAPMLAQLLVDRGPNIPGNDDLDVIGFVTAPGIHSTIKRCVVQGLRSSVALLGIIHAQVKGERPAGKQGPAPPWVAR